MESIIKTIDYYILRKINLLSHLPLTFHPVQLVSFLTFSTFLSNARRTGALRRHLTRPGPSSSFPVSLPTTSFLITRTTAIKQMINNKSLHPNHHQHHDV